MTQAKLLRLNGFEDVTRHIAQHIIEQFQSTLPRLDHIAVFLPNNSCSPYFRRCLLEALPADLPQALIPPWLGTLEQWAFETVPADSTLTLLSDPARQLVFIEALLQHPALFKDENKWQVTNNLLELFNELNLQKADISESSQHWLEKLKSAYGLDHSHQHLEQEAALVHRLWFAWHEQLQSSKLEDHSSAYLSRLQIAQRHLPDNFHCYAVLPDKLTRAEIDFINTLEDRQQCTRVEYLDTTDGPHNEVENFIQQAFSVDTLPLKQRSEAFKRDKKETQAPFSIFLAKDAEQEARAIDLQIRQWLLSDKKHIGIICEDRKLSRRVRALLERADVILQDMAGWSLSTTSAAAVLERWLECIEEDFDHRPMLDLLKSHFYNSEGREKHLENIYRLEKDVIQHESIERGLTRYREHLHYRMHRLSHWPKGCYQEIFALLDKLETTASELRQLQQSSQTAPLSDYLQALQKSLDELGLTDAFMTDAAGIRIMQSLSDLKLSLQHADPEMLWGDFRTWLGLSMESQLFSPQTASSAVQLMTLEQAELKHFDALIIAAVDPQHMPGAANKSAFFNQSARASLGLDSWTNLRQQRLQLFQQALLAASEVIISCKAEEAGEAVPLSPWIESLKNFHQLAYGCSIINQQLPQLLETNPGVFICDSSALPDKPDRPAPTVKYGKTASRLSASAHQRLLDCPYRYFAADELGLKATEEVSEELKKSDYGERIHLILQAFHQQTEDYPAPFADLLNEESRERAILHLTALSEQIFKHKLEDNLLHRSWLHRWKSHIPGYIDWQIKQQVSWKVEATELNIEVSLQDNINIFGRLDRLDRHLQDAKTQTADHSAYAIIDYKTGKTSNQLAIDSGEDVQLVSYALLEERASEVSYLLLDESNGKVKSGAQLSGEELDGLKIDVQKRLNTMLKMKQDGHALPAWGDNDVCKFCDFDGLCRRAVWNDDPELEH